MARDSWSASAPGKLMILGEHAVLHGAAAIVAAVDQRLRLHLTPRADQRIIVKSALGEHATTVADLAAAPSCRFVMAALRQRRAWLRGGCDLQIEADFDSRVGLGSSAAVTAATLAALDGWQGRQPEPAALLTDGLAAIRAVQGSGSGADLAASVYGGVLHYRAEPAYAERLAAELPLTVIYSGHKAKTPEVIRDVEERRQREPALFAALFTAIGASVEAAPAPIRAGDWERLGELADLGQGLMQAMGVSPPALSALVAALRQTPGIHGAKLSGAGMGDCLIGIGTAPVDVPLPACRLPLAVTPVGTVLE